MSLFSVSGLSSGIDTEGIISKLMDVERQPLVKIQNDQKALLKKIPIMQSINSLLMDFRNTMVDLTYETPFISKIVDSTNSAISASVTDSAIASGVNTIDSVSKVATATVANAKEFAGGRIDVTKNILSQVQKYVNIGSFSINNYTFFVDSSKDSIQKIIGDINTSTPFTGVTASYDYDSDKLVLKNATPGNKNAIILGSSSDTSNFLSAVGLSGSFQDISSGTTTVSTASHLGALDTNTKFSKLKFDEPFVEGKFKINSTEISVYSTDTINDLLVRINRTTAAGVTASYDVSTDKFQFISKNTGASYIKFENVSGGSNVLDLLGITGVKSEGPISKALDAGQAINGLKLNTAYNGALSSIRITGSLGSADFVIDGAQSINDIVSNINAQSLSTGVVAEFVPEVGKLKLKAATATDTAPITAAYNVGFTGNFLDSFNLAGATSSTNDYGFSVLESTNNVGLVKVTDTLGSANFKNAIPASGTLEINRGAGAPISIAYDSSMTFQQLIDNINSSGAQVTASFDSASGKFVLKPDVSSDPNIFITDSQPGPANLLNALGLTTVTASGNYNQKIGENAEYKLNGITYFSNSNTISDKISGVSFTLSGTTTTATTLAVKNDTAAGKTSIENFVKKYNELIEEINKQLTDEEGPLYRDSTLADILDTFRNSINKYEPSITGDYKSISDLGLTTGAAGMQFTNDYIGKLEINTKTLEYALSSNPEDVRKLFAFDETGGRNYTAGVAYNFSNYLDSLTRATGTVTKVIQLAQTQNNQMAVDIRDWKDRLAIYEDGLKTKFNAMEVMMGSLKRQGESLSQTIAQLGSFSS